MLDSADFGEMLPFSTDGSTLLPVFTTLPCTKLSSIGAAFRDWKSPRLFVWVSPSRFVQPLLFSLAHSASWAWLAAEVHGIWPLYSCCQLVTGCEPIIM